MRLAEKTICILILLSLANKMCLMTGGSLLFVFSLLLLSSVYFGFGFLLFNNIRLRDVFKKSAYATIPGMHIAGGVVTGIALSVACIALIFKFQSWSGSFLILFFSLVLWLPIFIIALVKMEGRHRDYYMRVLTRIGIVGGLNVFLLFTPATTLDHILYFNYPTYINALQKAHEHPDDKVLWDNAEDERRRIKNNH